MIVDRSVEQFLAHAGRVLMREEAVNSLILGLCSAIRRGRYQKYPPILTRVVDPGGELITVAIQTPPHNVILSRCSDPHVWPELAAGLVEANVIAPGALGPSREVGEFAEAWHSRTGHAYRVGRGSRIHQLDRVSWPTMPSGKMVPANQAQLDLVLDWTTKFVRESIPDEVVPITELLHASETRLHEGDVFVWSKDDEPVCMAYRTGPTPNGMRISGVYTPARYRGRGFASALVAHLSQRVLDEGRTLCFLYTDSENPISNRIYRRIGYREVCACRHVLFET